MSNLMQRYGPTALITGASSGIGAEFARQLATAGMNLILAARRRENMEALRNEIRADHDVQVRIEAVDLADDPGALIEATAGDDIDVLVNNAGFGEKDPFLDIDIERQLKMIRLNCATVIRLTHHYVGRMVQRDRGAVIITSSTGAYQALPYSAVYGATKAFDLHFGEALACELKDTNVDVLTLCPGPTDTEGPRRTGVDTDRVKMMPVGPVVTAALRSLGRRPTVIPGFTNRLGATLTRLVPRKLATRIAGRLIKNAAPG